MAESATCTERKASIAATDGSPPASDATSRAVRSRSRPTAHTASRARTSAALTCSSLRPPGWPRGRRRARPRGASSRPVSCSTRSAMTSAACAVAEQGPDPGHAPQLAVDAFDQHRRGDQGVGEGRVGGLGTHQRGEGAVERRDQGGGIAAPGASTPTNDPDDATHGSKG